MKRISCPKCGTYLTFDEKTYPANSILVFVCPSCGKEIKVRYKPGAAKPADTEIMGHLIVLENAFHHRQKLVLHPGENVIGRYVRGTRANAPIETTDPSMDTTHCIITVQKDKKGRIRFILRDAPSTTGTFLRDYILKDSDRIYLEDGDIITLSATSMIFHDHADDEDDNT